MGKSDNTQNFLDDHYYLFHSGADMCAYDFLGAHLEKRGSEEGAVFRVWAPEAKAVYVTGEFSYWQPCAVAMTKTSVGVWEVFISNIKEYTAYKYNIVTHWDAVLEKSDPFAFHNELRPGTASKVYDMTKYSWGDSEWLNKRKESYEESKPINIYEVHLGSWRRSADGSFYTYRRLADELIPYVREMGYTHIELLPITEHPLDMSWGYQCLGYFSPTVRYGEPRDFMHFIDKCHQSGIGVIIDWVPAHFPKDASGLYEFDGTPIYEGKDYVQREHPSWGTRIFDYGRNEVSSFLLSSATFWLEKYHADGFRVDAVASMLYRNFCREDGNFTPNIYGGRENLEAIEFLRKLNTSIRERYPDVLLMAEESSAWPMVTRPSHDGGLGFTHKWNMGWMNDVLEYIKKEPIYRQYHHNLITFSMMYAYSENYVLPLSHDEVVHLKNSLVGRMPGTYEEKFAGLRLLLAYQMVHPGKKLLFMGGEFGQFAEWSFERSLDWFLLDYPMHEAMQRYTKDLNNFYLSNRPLWDNDNDWSGFSWISCDNASENILALRRIDRDGEELIAVLNFAPVERWDFRIGLPEAGEYEEVFSSDAIRYGGNGAYNLTKTAEEIPCNGLNFSQTFTIPRLGVTILQKTKNHNDSGMSR